MKLYKSLLATLSIALVIGSFSVSVLSQSTSKPEPRRIRFIAGNTSGANLDSSGKVITKKSIALDRSELSDTAERPLLEKETFDLINLQRIEHGLPVLTWNQSLSDLARKHSENMAVYGFFSHIGVNGRLVDRRASDSGARSVKTLPIARDMRTQPVSLLSVGCFQKATNRTSLAVYGKSPVLVSRLRKTASISLRKYLCQESELNLNRESLPQ